MIAGAQLYPILSPLVDSEIYPLFAPEPPDGQERKTPYIVWQVISSQPENTYDGITGHEWVRVQIDVYDKSYDNCVQLSHNVVSALDRHIKPSVYDGTQQLYDKDAKLFRQSIDFEFNQTTPTT